MDPNDQSVKDLLASIQSQSEVTCLFFSSFFLYPLFFTNKTLWYLQGVSENVDSYYITKCLIAYRRMRKRKMPMMALPRTTNSDTSATL